MLSTDSLYAGKEQSQVKHEVLRRYLEQFSHIIFSKWDSITYIDGFSGPWNSVSSDLRDSSFSIAVHQLRSAKNHHAQRGRKVRAKCVFVEENAKAFEALKTFATQQSDIEVECHNATFEQSIPAILASLRANPQTFAFTLIDPTGWTGFALQRIRPLLRFVPGEVLVNFMTGHIIRFIDVPVVRPQLVAAFGSEEPLMRMGQLKGLERIDSCVEEYCKSLKDAGDFKFVCPAIVLQPTKDRPHFHLIYGSRSAKGLEVFKNAERKAMEVMEQSRAQADQRRRSSQGQRSLFDAKDMPPSQYYSDLRDRYINRAREEVQSKLKAATRVPYDDVWATALKQPLVWEVDVKSWIKVWQNADAVRIEGLEGKERVPKRGKNHVLVWTKAGDS